MCVMPPKFLHLCIILFAFPCALIAQGNKTDSLIHQVDEAVNNASLYIAKREKHIVRLRNRLDKTHDNREAYHVAFKLYEAYKPFVNDSAIFYLNRCIAMATASNNRQHANV